MAARLFQIDSYLRTNEAFHFVRKEISDAPPSAPHSHNYFELFLVESGGLIHNINGLEERLVAGDLVFIRPHDTHAIWASTSAGCRIANVMFRPETAEHLQRRYFDDLAGRFFWFQGPLPVKFTLSGVQFERAVNTTNVLKNSNRSLARIEHFLLSIMTHTLDEVATISHRAPGWLIAACEAVREPEVFRDGAAGFVRVAGRGHEHVCRQARQHLGLSPTEYVNRIRIQHAAMLLANTPIKISSVAEDCGFENQSYFHRKFREQYGATPREYRRAHLRDPVQLGLETD